MLPCPRPVALINCCSSALHSGSAWQVFATQQHTVYGLPAEACRFDRQTWPTRLAEISRYLQSLKCDDCLDIVASL